MKWITRERVRVDRVACPWLIKKFVDKDAEFLFIPTNQVMEVAEREGAIPYDVKEVELGHHGKECSFEAILKKYNLTNNPALVLLGKIVNGADTDNTLWHQPEGEGLEAIAEGFRHLGFKDDHELNAAEWIIYDALYAYCQEMIRQGRPNGAFKADPSQPNVGSCVRWPMGCWPCCWAWPWLAQGSRPQPSAYCSPCLWSATWSEPTSSGLLLTPGDGGTRSCSWRCSWLGRARSLG